MVSEPLFEEKQGITSELTILSMCSSQNFTPPLTLLGIFMFRTEICLQHIQAV
jgi:hypothetical protein